MTALRQRPQRPLGALDPRVPTRASHGMSLAERVVLRRAQDDRCAICGTQLGAAPHVDHDHELAALHPHPGNRGCDLCRRSLLCRACNLALGFLQDDADRIERAAAYIRAWRERLSPGGGSSRA